MRIIILITSVVLLFLMLILSSQFIEIVDASDIVVKQSIGGDLEVWTDPGPHWQGFGRIATYPKSRQLWFSKKNDEGKDNDDSIKVRFNDGGHAQLSGSLRYTLPLDKPHVLKLRQTYGSQDALEHDLIKQVVTKAVYMTGPLMSSKESNAERRPDVIRFIEDQVAYGVYQTTTKQVKIPDPITGVEKTVAIVEIVPDPKSPGGYARQEASPLVEFGIRTSNTTINSIDYDVEVEKQIQAQQKAYMDVQTAQANAKKAEQDALTVAKQGEANAAREKWAQEAIKAKEVTLAEQERAVAEIGLAKAELQKKTNIAEGEGQAEKARLLISANGALEQKLSAYVTVNKMYADAMSKQKWVPEIMMGSASSTGGNAASLVDMFMAKTAKDLSLDLKIAK